MMQRVLSRTSRASPRHGPGLLVKKIIEEHGGEVPSPTWRLPARARDAVADPAWAGRDWAQGAVAQANIGSWGKPGRHLSRYAAIL
jgi:hypothetical protein